MSAYDTLENPRSIFVYSSASGISPGTIVRPSKETRKCEVEIPNNSWILVFTSYSLVANFVYWVGFVTGISFTVHLWIVDFKDFLPFGENRPLSLGC